MESVISLLMELAVFSLLALAGYLYVKKRSRYYDEQILKEKENAKKGDKEVKE